MKLLRTTLFACVIFVGASIASPPVNEVCPVCGKPGRLIYRTYHNKENVIFDSSECKAKFDKEPDKYPVKKKDS